MDDRSCFVQRCDGIMTYNGEVSYADGSEWHKWTCQTCGAISELRCDMSTARTLLPDKQYYPVNEEG